MSAGRRRKRPIDRCVDIISRFSGRVFRSSDVAKELVMHRETARRYINLLERMGIVERLDGRRCCIPLTEAEALKLLFEKRKVLENIRW